MRGLGDDRAKKQEAERHKMQREELRGILSQVELGQMDVEDAVAKLAAFPTSLDLGHSTIDTAREARCGCPEVVYGAGKTPQELLEISHSVLEHHERLLVTRATDEGQALLKAELEGAVFHERSRAVTVGAPTETELKGLVAVVSAGTSDGAVAEEAAVTAQFMGARVAQIRDAGVAGLHRLLSHGETLQRARALVVVAGMEGALPSVVGGLVSRPVIAVPTSVGYGASFGGIAALLGMLNSCAAGVTVVNIDNGFGAGYTAALINGCAETTQEGDPE